LGVVDVGRGAALGEVAYENGEAGWCVWCGVVAEYFEFGFEWSAIGAGGIDVDREEGAEATAGDLADLARGRVGNVEEDVVAWCERDGCAVGAVYGLLGLFDGGGTAGGAVVVREWLERTVDAC
jgi:hypothetical protein